MGGPQLLTARGRFALLYTEKREGRLPSREEGGGARVFQKEKEKKNRDQFRIINKYAPTA